MVLLAVATNLNKCKFVFASVLLQISDPGNRIVAANDVSASTAQLVAASRVKADFMSQSQDRLESASKAVTSACRSLVRQVQEIIAAKNRDDGEELNYSELSAHEFKMQEMEQQVWMLVMDLMCRPNTNAQ